MKAHFFDSEDPISIFGFLTPSSFRVIQTVLTWVPPHYVNETLTNALNSRMCATEKSSHVATSVCKVKTRSRNLLQLYTEVENFLLKKFATGQAIVESAQLSILAAGQHDAAVVRRQLNCKIVQGSRCIRWRNAEWLLIEKVGLSIRQILKHYQAQSPQANLTDITFKAGSL